MVEEIIRDTAKTDNEWKIAILRMAMSLVHLKMRCSEKRFPPLPKNIIPLLMQVAAKQRDHIELRKSAQTTDHTVERSFLHILDACDAIAASLQWLSTQQFACEAFNIAGQSVFDTAVD